MLIPLVNGGLLSKDDVRTIVAICDENDQVFSSFQFEKVLRAIHNSDIMTESELDTLPTEYPNVEEHYHEVLSPKPDEGETENDSIPF